VSSLTARVAAAVDALVPAGATCLVGVSGGPDSLALLDLLHLTAALHGRSLVVGHIDHGIAEGSARVADRVEALATERGIPIRRVRLELGGGASETRARGARRAALIEIARDVDARAILLAHHADDQAETVLLRLLRGSGPAGLAGMAARSGIWVRPLLGITRAELAEHLASRGLEGWQDPANTDPRHLRSWLRGAILPRLAERLPDLTSRLLRAARQAAAARQGWDAIPELLAALELRTDSGAISVAAPPLWGYRSEVRHAVLAALGRRFGVPLGERRLSAIDRLAHAARGTVRLADTLEVELFDGRLTLKPPVTATDAPVALEIGQSVRLGRAAFLVESAAGGETSRGGWSTQLKPGRYLARPWRRGDRIRPLGGQGSRAVAVLLREARVPVGRRSAWPVVTRADDATIVWVPGICRADAALPEPGTKALHVECAFT